ncbi:MAG: hypothetical protein ACSLFI_08790 [Solirubrobacterales bacterium]
MKKIRGMYGASPLHFLAVISSFAIAAYAFTRIFAAPAPESTLLFFVLAIFAHDLIAFPLYSLLNLIANRGMGSRSKGWMAERKVPPINYLRVPLVLSAFAFIIFFPLILGLSAERYENSTGLSSDIFFGRWLGLCAALFTISAIAYAINLRRASVRLGPSKASGD